jgi:hypothetical protein
MEITGRHGEAIKSVDDWQKHGGPASATHWKPGRSAFELASDFIERDGEVRLAELVALLDEVGELALTGAVAEKKTHFDAHSGPRNHDLLVRGRSGAGAITIGVEAKADEPFDDPLWLYREKALTRMAETKALARIDHLVDLWFSTTLRRDRTVPPLVVMGYQLFSALAGTLADAKTDGSSLAVVVVWEFRTHLTDDVEHEHNAQMLDDFLLRLFGPEQSRRSTAEGNGWITQPQSVRGDAAKMPASTSVAFAKISRDLRTGRPA